jgi:hypothetical protein
VTNRTQTQSLEVYCQTDRSDLSQPLPRRKLRAHLPGHRNSGETYTRSSTGVDRSEVTLLGQKFHWPDKHTPREKRREGDQGEFNPASSQSATQPEYGNPRRGYPYQRRGLRSPYATPMRPIEQGVRTQQRAASNPREKSKAGEGCQRRRSLGTHMAARSDRGGPTWASTTTGAGSRSSGRERILPRTSLRHPASVRSLERNDLHSFPPVRNPRIDREKRGGAELGGVRRPV